MIAQKALYCGIILFLVMFLVFPAQAANISISKELSANFTPKNKKIEGIPIKQIDPDWLKVLVLTEKNTTVYLDEDTRYYVKQNRLYFSREGDFNGDTVKDKIVVGVYHDKSGKLGRFLLILTENDQKRWKKDFLVKTSDGAGLSVLSTGNGGGVQWSFCTACDDFYALYWNNGKYNLDYSGDYVPKS